MQIEQLTKQTCRYYKRKYESDKQTHIEHLRTSDPKKFWNALKNIGPKQTSNKMINPDGQMTSNKNDVLNVWKNKFEILYSCDICTNTVFDDYINDTILNHVPVFTDNDILMNEPFILEEIKRAIKQNKITSQSVLTGYHMKFIKAHFLHNLL